MSDAPTLVKCLVWDLDNTLWRGTLLEDHEVVLPEEIRRTIVELDARGILQAVASKNDHDHAWQQLEALGVAEYFVLPRIGWHPKSRSVKEIADGLNFALKTVAFIDDQPAERAEVAHHHPEVRCFDAALAAELTGLPEFSPAVVTVDAARRRSMYQAGFRRTAEREEFTGPDEAFLRSLDLVMEIKRADDADLSRVEELTLRTSQMNATGVYYSDADLRALIADPEHEVLTVSLTDRFGPHGAVGVLLVGYHERVWHLKLLATSCRVVSFGAGAVLLDWLIGEAAAAGVHLAADFRRTDRNRMMEIAYRFAGFTDAACDCLAELRSADADADADADAGAAGSGRAGIEFRHLVADRRPAPTTVRVDAPALGPVASTGSAGSTGGAGA
ncbi:HAD-IIIC family phosphatase [Kitasatospora xanthocidica]|uniref:HAD-IIIC family phosphatase n=1 Tax=Kitasatospora xanthocidica TaxID=83382 RepID=A0A373A1Y9_9ACTN|nr:HAD-IIIC family phosphatase [Kitasatospora xanthocidica]RGD62168.1 HAD-IIIC family phosphatase [Kitasatospora xanthocidica]